MKSVGFPVFLTSEGALRAEREGGPHQDAWHPAEAGGMRDAFPDGLSEEAPPPQKNEAIAEADRPTPDAAHSAAVPVEEDLLYERTPSAAEEAEAVRVDDAPAMEASEKLEVFVGEERVEPREGELMASPGVWREVVQGVEIIVPRLIANELEPPPLPGPPFEALHVENPAASEPQDKAEDAPPAPLDPSPERTDTAMAGTAAPPEPEPGQQAAIEDAVETPAAISEQGEPGAALNYTAPSTIAETEQPPVQPAYTLGQESERGVAVSQPGPNQDVADLQVVVQGPPPQEIAPPEISQDAAASAMVEGGTEAQAAPAPLDALEAGVLVEGPPYLQEDALGAVASILTPEDNTMPSAAEYLARLFETDNIVFPSVDKTASEAERGGGAWGVPLPVRRDILVEVTYSEGDGKGLSFGFLRKPHPMSPEASGRRVRPEDIGDELLEASASAGDINRREFVLAAAAKGAYAFIMENGGRPLTVDIKFTLMGGGANQRVKEYKGVGGGGGEKARFLFLMPEALFWDDEGYYTGVIEGPDAVTKFSDVTGLVWKEANEE